MKLKVALKYTHNRSQAREQGLSRWEDVLKGQAKEASEGIDKLRERSEAVEAEERRAQEAKAELARREKALTGREAELAEMEAGREARAAELKGVRDRLALMEKGLEGERTDLARRKVVCLPFEGAVFGLRFTCVCRLSQCCCASSHWVRVVTNGATAGLNVVSARMSYC